MDKDEIFEAFAHWLEIIEEQEEEQALEDSERENRYYNPDLDEGKDIMEMLD